MASDETSTNKNTDIAVDFISSDNVLLGRNIQVHYKDFPKPDIGDFVDMYAPEQIYLRTNYPKISLEYKDDNGNVIDYDSVDVNTNLYQPHKDMIVFAIFPVGGLKLNDGLEYYTDITDDELKKYPSLSITPTGNLISSGILPDKIFKNNGLYAEDAAEPLLTQNKGIPFENGERKDTKTVSFNGENREIIVYNWKINKQQSSDFLHLTTNDFGSVKESPSKVNFTYINGNGISGIEGMAELVKNIQSSSSSTQSSSSLSNSSEIRRTFELDNYNIEHPDLKLEDGSSSGTGEDDKENTADSGLSFLIAVDFYKETSGFCELKFGKNIFQLPTDGSPKICVNGDTKWTSCKLDKDVNNLPKLPKFLNTDGFTKVKTAIFYPVWNGIAVQPGISLAVPSSSYKQGEPTVYPIGTVAECPLTNPVRKTHSKYLEPDYPTWIKQGSHGLAKTGHIKLIPNNARWDGKLSASFVNTVGNFFYMPIFFVPHSKFRMYFSGIKVGEYTPEDDPDVDYSYIYRYSGESNSIIDGTDGFPEYSYPVELDGTKEDISNGKLVYIHTYEGSVIYSYPDEVKTESKVSFISERTIAKMIPPKVPDGIEGKEERQFWREYNKTVFFLDFEIKNPNFVDGATILQKGLPRKPVEILGILLTHIREIKSSPIKNENGIFNVEPQSDIGDFKYSQLFAHKQECDCPKPWIHYATSINITHNQDGSEGNIVLDKYSLMGQDIFPKQHFGGVRLMLHDGNQNFIHSNVPSASKRSKSDGATPYIFSGIATETKHMDSFNSDTLDISLKGLQYKLEDIKLINAPFFDGDYLSVVMRWFSKYTGVEIDMSFANKEARIPTSSNFAKPFLMLAGGTPAIDGIRQACESANHRFILQPDGVGYVYEMSSEFSLPLVCKPGYTLATVLGEIPTDSIMSIDVQPFFGNLYNVVISAALLGTNNTIEAPDSGENVVEIKLNQRISHMITEPNLPWSRVIAHSWKGYMDEKQLSERHKIDRSMSKRYWVNGSISIPGNANVWIYDQIMIFGQWFYITDISHSIDFSSKTFKTNLNISKYLEEEV